MKYTEIAWAERKADVYAGPNCDEHKPIWWAHFDGDREAGASSEPLALDPKQFPAGTKITISVPVCPECEQDAEMCQISGCEFDWKVWAEEQYS